MREIDALTRFDQVSRPPPRRPDFESEDGEELSDSLYALDV